MTLHAGNTALRNNLSQIVESGGGQATPGFYVTLFAVGNCLGRITIGVGSDLVIERLPRACFLALTAALFAALFLLAIVGRGGGVLYRLLRLINTHNILRDRELAHT